MLVRSNSARRQGAAEKPVLYFADSVSELARGTHFIASMTFKIVFLSTYLIKQFVIPLFSRRYKLNMDLYPKNICVPSAIYRF
jgi:hypothetical protein